MVFQLTRVLPPDFTVEPRVHLGSIDADFPDQYEYEVLVFDQSRGRVLVAAVPGRSGVRTDSPSNLRSDLSWPKGRAAPANRNVGVPVGGRSAAAQIANLVGR